MQLDPSGEFEAAANWLPMALRSGLSAQIDEAAVLLALEEIGQDYQDRGVNLSPVSLADSGFIPRLCAHLAAAPEAA
ncbi:hypothetical protein CSC81_18315, partial [Tenacibaculum discolor]